MLVAVISQLVIDWGWQVIFGALGLSLMIHGLSQILKRYQKFNALIAALPGWLSWQMIVGCLWAGVAVWSYQHFLGNEVSSPKIDSELSHRLAISGLEVSIQENGGKNTATVCHVINNKANDPISYHVEAISISLGGKTRNLVTIRGGETVLPPSTLKLFIFPAIDVADLWDKDVAMVANIIVKYRFENGTTFRLLRQTRTCSMVIKTASQRTPCPLVLDEDDQLAQQK